MLKRITKYLLFSILLNTLIIPLYAEDNPNTSTHLNLVLYNFNLFVENTLEEWNLPGAAIAIVQNDSIVFMKGYGLRKLGHPQPIDTHTVFRIASVSKGFASTLTGLLVEEGVLDWHDKVIGYLPEISLKDTASAQNLTIRHILSHTSGLVPHAYDNLIESNVPYKNIVKELKNASIIGLVGTCYGYQNVVYSLIGEIIETATGREYEDLLRKRLFEPLGMKDVSLGWDALMAKSNRAYPHIIRYYDSITTHDKKAYYSVLPSAGVNASISDMAQWLRAQLGGMPRVISPEILQKIHIPLIRTRREMRRYNWNGLLRDAHYGMGWRIFNYAGYTMIFHSGSIQGYLAQMGFIPEQHIGIVVLLNSRRIDFLLPTFFDMYLNLKEPEGNFR